MAALILLLCFPSRLHAQSLSEADRIHLFEGIATHNRIPEPSGGSVFYSFSITDCYTLLAVSFAEETKAQVTLIRVKDQWTVSWKTWEQKQEVNGYTTLFGPHTMRIGSYMKYEAWVECRQPCEYTIWRVDYCSWDDLREGDSYASELCKGDVAHFRFSRNAEGSQQVTFAVTSSDKARILPYIVQEASKSPMRLQDCVYTARLANDDYRIVLLALADLRYNITISPDSAGSPTLLCVSTTQHLLQSLRAVLVISAAVLALLLLSGVLFCLYRRRRSAAREGTEMQRLPDKPGAAYSGLNDDSAIAQKEDASHAHSESNS